MEYRVCVSDICNKGLEISYKNLREGMKKFIQLLSISWINFFLQFLQNSIKNTLQNNFFML